MRHAACPPQVVDYFRSKNYRMEGVPPAVELLISGRHQLTQQVPQQAVEALVHRHLPAGLWNQLYPYQKDGVKFGLSRRGRYLLADEM